MCNKTPRYISACIVVEWFSLDRGHGVFRTSEELEAIAVKAASRERHLEEEVQRLKAKASLWKACGKLHMHVTHVVISVV